jgi:hypothetical protein
MALRSAENCDDEMVGVEAEDEDVVELVVALALELALEAELLVLLLLPQPAATAATTTPKAHSLNQRKLITARSSHSRANDTDYLLTGDPPPVRHTVSDGDPFVHRD